MKNRLMLYAIDCHLLRISFIFLGFSLIFTNGYAQSEKNKKEEKPIEYYEKLVENQQKALDLHNEGYLHFRRKEYTEALELFNQAIALDTVNSHYFTNRGHTLYHLGYWKKALTDYQKAIKIDPDITHENYLQSGDILQKKLGNYQQAIAMYDQAVIVMRDNQMPVLIYKCYFNRGNCNLKLKKFEQAVKDYSQTIKLKPDHAGSYTNRGMARYNLKDKTGACADWKKAVELGFTSAQSYVDSYCK